MRLVWKHGGPLLSLVCYSGVASRKKCNAKRPENVARWILYYHRRNKRYVLHGVFDADILKIKADQGGSLLHVGKGAARLRLRAGKLVGPKAWTPDNS